MDQMGGGSWNSLFRPSDRNPCFKSPTPFKLVVDQTTLFVDFFLADNQNESMDRNENGHNEVPSRTTVAA